MKKIVTAFCMAAVCTVLLQSSLSAANTADENTHEASNGIQYTLMQDGSYTVSGADSGITSLEIQSTFNGKPVKRIGFSAFADCKELTRLVIADGVVSIQEKAFFNCEKLTDLALPKTLISIGDMAFAGCKSLENITFYNGIEIIGEDAFASTGIKSASMPESVMYIGKNAFGNSDIESVSFGSDVEFLRENTFSDCGQLKDVILPDTFSKLSNMMFYNCFALKSVVIPASVTELRYDILPPVLDTLTIKSDIEYANASFLNGRKIGQIVFDSRVTVCRLEISDKYSKPLLIEQIVFPDTTQMICGTFTPTADTEICFGGTVEQWRGVISASTDLKHDFTNVKCTDGVWNAQEATE